MTRDPASHLAPDDFESWIAGTLAPPLLQHLEGCPACREQARLERELHLLLSSIGHWSPRNGFGDRVMAQVQLADPFHVHALGRLRRQIFASRRSLAAAASVLVFLLGSMSASIVWTLSHRATLQAVADWTRLEVTRGLWLAGRSLLTAFLEQPWSGSVRAWFGSGSHLALVLGGALAVYVAGLLVFRRLLALPAPRAADGQA